MSSIEKEIIISETPFTKEENDIFFLPVVLRQLILEYLRFNEALDLYVYFNVNKPERFVLYLDDSEYLEYLEYLKNNKDHATRHTDFYIEHKDSARLNKDNLLLLFKLSGHYNFYFVCPHCKRCSLLKFRRWRHSPDSGHYFSIIGFFLRRGGTTRMQSFCYCGIKHYIENIDIKDKSSEKSNIRKSYIFPPRQPNIDDVFYYVYNLKNNCNKLKSVERFE